MSSPNLVLIGLMGSGKSTVGRLVARRIGLVFVDMDEELERLHGPIRAVLEQTGGDEDFGLIERRLAEQLASRRGLVVATGGRTMLDQRAADALSAAGTVVCLDAADAIVARPAGAGGPLPGTTTAAR